MRGESRKKKSDKNRLTQVIVLITAILNLIKIVIELVNKFID